jgi:WhiB family redox-sensing transcriptional regulator
MFDASDAACRDTDPEIFFEKTTKREALALCRQCPQKFECLTENLREEYGIWGGTTEGARRRMRRALRAQAV